ncbi:MAG: phytanoyl-CoA dioxygenase family protein [Saprospiraceae bacterium]
MKKLFTDPVLQAQFEQDGVLKLKVLHDEQVATLLEFYSSLGIKDDKGFGFHVSMDKQDKALVRRVVDKIYEVVLPATESVFSDAKVFTASFVIKEPNPKGVVPIHQDWSFVDQEGEYNSITVWIALVDMNIDIGTLGAIKGSHNFFQHTRPSPSPQASTPLANQQFPLFPYLKTLDVKAGEAIVFDNRTFHASPPNTTDRVRVAVGLGFTQSDAQLCHYYLKPDGNKNRLLKYKVDEDFFIKYDNARLSAMYDQGKLIEDYELMEEVEYKLPTFTNEQMLDMVKGSGNLMNLPLIEKLAVIFNYNPDGSKPEEKQEIPSPINEPPKKPFWQVYTPINILKEIHYRLTR